MPSTESSDFKLQSARELITADMHQNDDTLDTQHQERTLKLLYITLFLHGTCSRLKIYKVNI